MSEVIVPNSVRVLGCVMILFMIAIVILQSIVLYKYSAAEACACTNASFIHESFRELQRQRIVRLHEKIGIDNTYKLIEVS